MLHTKQPLVVANWKMNPLTLVEAKKIATETKSMVKKYTGVTVVIAPPVLFIGELSKIIRMGVLKLGAQTAQSETRGAYTGEISVAQLAAYGVSYVIFGHSERRTLGETDEQIAKKVGATLKAKLTPIICVGERVRDSQGNFYSEIEAQIKTALAGVPAARYKDVVIAYEPIWAIGTGGAATEADVCEMQLFIKKVLTKHGNRTAASKVRVLYGGSVNAENAAGLYAAAGIDGFLVGGASLKPAEFGTIVASIK